jgi:hypothetical protein
MIINEDCLIAPQEIHNHSEEIIARLEKLENLLGRYLKPSMSDTDYLEQRFRFIESNLQRAMSNKR